MPAAAAALAALDAWLALAARPGEGQALLDALAPTALVPVAHRLEPVGRVDGACYARARLQDAATRPTFGPVSLAGWERTGEAATLLGASRELADDRPVELVAGFERLAGAWRLAWVTLAPPLAGEAFWRAAALAEAAAGPAWAAETWLERAYRRTVRRPEPVILASPGARFTCHGTGSCCRNALAIELPPAAQGLIDAIPWEAVAPHLAGTQLEVRPNGKLRLRSANEPCRFLDPDGRCLIHRALGRAAFGPCAVYPYVFASTPDGVVAHASGGCPSARQRQGELVGSQVADLYERLYMAAGVQVAPDGYRLETERVVPWEAFCAVEGQVLAAFASEAPLHGQLLAAAAAVEGPAPEACLPPTPAEVRAMAELMAALTEGLMDPRDIRGLWHGELREAASLRQLLVDHLYARRAALRHDLLTAVNLAALLYFMALGMQLPYRGRPLPAGFWEHLGSLLTHAPGFLELPGRAEASPLAGAALRRRGFVARLVRLAAP